MLGGITEQLYRSVIYRSSVDRQINKFTGVCAVVERWDYWTSRCSLF